MSAFHLAGSPTHYAVERGQWAEAAALPERTPSDFPWEKFPWPEAIMQFARGLGSARSGDIGGAQRAVERLTELETRASNANEAYFATQIEISRLAVEAWPAHAELEIWPGRYNSLRGAALSADAAGDFVAAAHNRTALANLLDTDSKPHSKRRRPPAGAD